MAAEKNTHKFQPKIKTPEHFKELAEEYFDSDKTYHDGIFSPSFSGLAAHMGISNCSIRRYQYYKGFADAFKYAADIINNTPNQIAGKRKMYKSEEALQEKIDEYFDNEAYEDGEFKPTLAGLALKLGMTRKTLHDYSKDDQFYKVIQNARQRIEEKLERRLNYAETSVTGVIFNLKNNFGYKDRIENYNENKIVDNGDNEF